VHLAPALRVSSGSGLALLVLLVLQGVPVTGEIARRKGNARSKSNELQSCGNNAIPGGTVCRVHGGEAPAVKDAAARRLLQAKLNNQLATMGWEPVTDPVAAYADLAGEVLAFRDLARAKLNELEGNWSYLDVRMVEDARALVGVYERALDRCDKILASTLKLGLDAESLRQGRERPTREQAERLIDVMGKVLADPRVTVSGDPKAVILDALGDLAPGGA